MIWPLRMFHGTFGCYDSWVASWVVRFGVIGHIVQDHRRCGQLVPIVLLKIMGLHRGCVLRQVFVMRLVWDHIFPRFLVTVVHVFAHLACLWWSLFGNGVAGPSGSVFNAAEFLPVRLTCCSDRVVQTATALGQGWSERSGLAPVDGRGSVATSVRIVPIDGCISALWTIVPSGPLDHVVESNLLRFQNGSEPMWDVTALGRS